MSQDERTKTEAMIIVTLLVAIMNSAGIPKTGESTQLAFRMLQGLVEGRITEFTPEAMEKELTFALASLRLDTTAPAATC